MKWGIFKFFIPNIKRNAEAKAPAFTVLMSMSFNYFSSSAIFTAIYTLRPVS